MLKTRLITLALALTASPLALFFAKLVIGTKTSGGGGSWVD